MKSRRKIVLIAFVTVVLLCLGTLVAASAAAVTRGTVRVRVDSGGADGGRFSLAVPAVLVDSAIALAPVGLLADEVPTEDLRPWLPAIRELARQIDRLPDCVLVDVRGPGETVRVEKRDGRLVILVEDGDETVSVSVPARTVSRAMRRLERLI